MQAYHELVWNIFTNISFFRVGVLLGVFLTIILVVIFAGKKNRDERGWKILGKASVISFTYLVIMINIIAKTTGHMEIVITEPGYLFYSCMLQWLYDTVIAIEIIAIAIFRITE